MKSFLAFLLPPPLRKLLRRTLTGFALSAALLHAQPLSLADAALRGAAIFDQSAVTGMVLVVVRNQDAMVKTYGETFPGSGQKPNSLSLIRLCSISKVFAGELLLDLANEGKLTLTDPLQRFAPPKTIVPHGPGGAPITLRDLATHTAGLPREVGSYPANIPHFTFPDRAFRWRWLPRQKLANRPGSVALYSNVGFDLLGDALASAANEPYVQLLNERIVRPLGLRDTTLTPTAAQCARLLRGAGDEGPCTGTEASAASGGVYSSPADMARVLQYLLHIPGTPAPSGPAISPYLKPTELKSVQGLSHAGDPTGIGLGWIQLGDPESPSALMQKTGGGAGFQTYIALSLPRQAGIFLAVTEGKGHAQINLLREANNLLAAVADIPPLPPKAQPVHAGKKKRSRKQRVARP